MAEKKKKAKKKKADPNDVAGFFSGILGDAVKKINKRKKRNSKPPT